MKKRFLSISLLLYLLLNSACSVQPVKLEGIAMRPALNDGDKVLIDRKPNELNRGDVITFLYPKDKTKWYFKRIIGLPHETVEIREGKVFINGKILDEPYVNEEYNQLKASFPPQKIPENHYFVLGDNRDNSSDSRYWGTVDRELITGKYYMTYSEAQK